jgi:hypothetical protein
MRKYIKPEELPEILDEETIKTLVEMCEEFPKKDFNWSIVSELLLQRGQLNIILDLVEVNQTKKAEHQKSQMTEEEKIIDEQKKQALLKKLEEDPQYFYGNMSRPDTPEEFKSRFGVWPDGTDGDTYDPR